MPTKDDMSDFFQYTENRLLAGHGRDLDEPCSCKMGTEDTVQSLARSQEQRALSTKQASRLRGVTGSLCSDLSMTSTLPDAIYSQDTRGVFMKGPLSSFWVRHDRTPTIMISLQDYFFG